MMQPYYDHDGITIYHGDCREILPTLGEMDIAITSPPYNIGAVHHNNKSRHSPYPDNLPESTYQDMQIFVLRLLHGRVKSVFYNHKNRIRDGIEVSPRTWLDKTPWTCRQSLVWVNGGPNHDPCRFYPKTERVYWLAKPDTPWLENRKYWDVLECSPDVVSLAGKDHTRSFPLSLAQKILGVAPWANRALDPFMGSGTTLVAAKNLGRQAVGIEIQEKYCEIAVKRLAQEVLPFAV